ncbi:MAG: DNA polymerase/3'-5' exonuclease PolX, partial [bacterium]|nr:DNA polymerase/3'-5' exonuclease PolX [bacterium]
RKIPVNLSELLQIESLGPKRIKVLYQELGIRNQEDLKKAVRTHKIRDLQGFGEKSERKILEALKFQDSSPKRFLLGSVFSIIKNLTEVLKKSGFFDRLEPAGSFRRRQETLGDIDILATSKNPARAMDFFVKNTGAVAVLAHGSTKSEVRLSSGVQVDLRIVPEDSWGAALQYFTGDKSHNIKLRKIAIEKGMKLSEYGLTPHNPPSQGGKRRGVSAIKNEEEIYKTLGMDFIPPELRTDSGEIEAASRQARGKPGGLPKLINYGDVRGDLQVQTNWTDGSSSIEQMAQAAMKLGREYIAITDHTKALAMTHGLDEKKLLKQMKEIERVNADFRMQNADFRILKGSEVDILKDGRLDLADHVLAKLDVVGVSIHSHFNLSRQDMTQRLVRALSNPHVDIFFHPTTRLINRRKPIDFDFAEILKICKKNKVALEINSFPDRLDIHDTLIREAVAAGVKLVINTDAHSPKHLEFMHFGEAQARRGWASKNDVLNTKPLGELLKYLKK